MRSQGRAPAAAAGDGVVKAARRELLTLRAFGNIVLRYWRESVGAKQNRPCERAIERALRDAEEHFREGGRSGLGSVEK